MKKKWDSQGNNYKTATEKVWGVGSDEIKHAFFIDYHAPTLKKNNLQCSRSMAFSQHGPTLVHRGVLLFFF